MHQRGYIHPETNSACGLPSGAAYNYQVNTVPYMVGACIGEVIARSGKRCGFPIDTCGPNAVMMIDAFASGGCSCHPDVRLFVPGDYLGRGLSSLRMWRGSTGTWRTADPWNSVAVSTAAWGVASVGDIPVSGDFDGDRIADRAVWRGPEGGWHILTSLGGEKHDVWGAKGNGDVPVPGDYDGDRIADIAVWRGPEGGWHIKRASGGEIHDFWGSTSLGDIPVPSDYDGDGVADLAVWREPTGEWHVKTSRGELHQQWGTAGDIPVPGDYDGDGKTDFAVYRPSSGTWFIMRTLGGTFSSPWGSFVDHDIPVPGDYDGDGRWDFAIYRPTDGNWHIKTTSSGEVHAFIFATDKNLDQPVGQLIRP
jgi:hypothetical protein